MSEYFRKPKSFGGRVKVELVLSNYTTKADLKNANFGKKIDLASLKSEVDKLEKVLTGLNGLKSKIDKLDVDKMFLLIK